MEVKFIAAVTGQSDAIVLGINKGLEFSSYVRDLNTKTGSAIQNAVDASYFKGEQGQTLLINSPNNVSSNRILLLGLGDAAELDDNALNVIGSKITSELSKTPDQTCEVFLDGMSNSDVANFALGAYLRSWRFDKYRTKEEDNRKPKLKEICFIVQQPKEAQAAFDNLKAVADAVFLTREVVSEPANIIYPETLAQRASELKSLGIKIEVLGEKEMQDLGMNALLGVGQGSIRESQLVIMQWNGADNKDAPVAFVGKGVTFDTGGISIKPADGMGEMKWDMGGAGVVIGVMKALASRKAKVNAVGVVGLVENMPSGNAQRPGDVVKSMSGQTIEILNTDAEGRLVLADALWYTQDRFKPKFMVDLATLTMAIIIALGHEYAGLFSNSDELSERLIDSGEKVNEKLCRLPLHKNFDKDIDSDIADVQNIQRTPRAAGSITAAHFLKRFVNEVPWAHLDIAGTTWSNKDLDLSEKGATGFGVRLLDQLVRDYYETA